MHHVIKILNVTDVVNDDVFPSAYQINSKLGVMVEILIAELMI